MTEVIPNHVNQGFVGLVREEAQSGRRDGPGLSQPHFTAFRFCRTSSLGHFSTSSDAISALAHFFTSADVISASAGIRTKALAASMNIIVSNMTC
jgi:hypothetical protein